MVHIEEIIKAYRTLQKLEPKNQLLTYMRVDNDFTIAWPVHAHNAFVDKYVRKNLHDTVKDVDEVYLSELAKAIDDANRRYSRPAPNPQNYCSKPLRQKPQQQKMFGNP